MEHPDQQGQPQTMSNSAGQRMTSKEVLAGQIRRLHEKADELQVIADMLPSNPTPQQDDALWRLFCSGPLF